MHGHVSALKPYVIMQFEFETDKLPVGADAVSSLQSKSKSRGKGRAKRWPILLHSPCTFTRECSECCCK